MILVICSLFLKTGKEISKQQLKNKLFLLITKEVSIFSILDKDINESHP